VGPEPLASLVSSPYGEKAIRAELYGPERLDEQARRLASASVIDPRLRSARPLLDRFRENCRLLSDAHAVIAECYRLREPMGTDAEWLLDNFHIVADAMREVRIDLPRGYHSQLPKVGAVPFRGFPRIYALALSLIAHTDSLLDEANVTQFVQVYEGVTPLLIGELWAIPTMLRMGLLENLRRLAAQIMQGRCERQLAWNHARRWNAGPRTGPDADLSAPLLPDILSEPLAVHLLQALRELGPTASAG